MSISPNHCGKYPSTGTGIYVKLALPIERYPGLEKEIGQVVRVQYNLPRRGETAWTVEFRNTQDNDPASPRKYLMLNIDSYYLEKHDSVLPVCDQCQVKRQGVCWEVACRYGWRASLLGKNAPESLRQQLGLERQTSQESSVGVKPDSGN